MQVGCLGSSVGLRKTEQDGKKGESKHGRGPVLWAEVTHGLR